MDWLDPREWPSSATRLPVAVRDFLTSYSRVRCESPLSDDHVRQYHPQVCGYTLHNDQTWSVSRVSLFPIGNEVKEEMFAKGKGTEAAIGATVKTWCEERRKIERYERQNEGEMVKT